CATFHDFKVKRMNILVWLKFLKENNPFYKNIEIDQDMLQTLPENGSVFKRLRTIHDDNSLTKDIVNLSNGHDNVDISDDHITYSFVPNPISKETEE
ncbi:22049_t:CDS:1, partial [Racocetra persica]